MLPTGGGTRLAPHIGYMIKFEDVCEAEMCLNHCARQWTLSRMRVACAPIQIHPHEEAPKPCSKNQMRAGTAICPPCG